MQGLVSGVRGTFDSYFCFDGTQGKGFKGRICC